MLGMGLFQNAYRQYEIFALMLKNFGSDPELGVCIPRFHYADVSPACVLLVFLYDKTLAGYQEINSLLGLPGLVIGLQIPQKHLCMEVLDLN